MTQDNPMREVIAAQNDPVGGLTSDPIAAGTDAATTAAPAAEAPRAKRVTQRQLIRRRFLRNKPAVVGMAVILAMFAMAWVVPNFLPWRYDQLDNNAFYAPPGTGNHLLGTTQAGADVLALTMRGLSKSLIIGFMVALLQTSIAALVGSSVAYIGGVYQTAMMWIVDLLLVIPSFFLIAIVTTGGPKGPHAWLLLVVLLAFFGWPLSSRVVRSMSMSVKEREYVQAAKYMGLSTTKTLIRHIIPNISSMLIVDACLGVGYAILAEAGLSFFGFGVQAPDTSLGTLIAEGQQTATTFPWIFLAPATFLVILVMCVNAIGDGLRDALDPNSMSGGRA